MNRLTLNQRPVVTLRQRRPIPPFMGCREQAHQPANRQWAFDFIVKPNSGRKFRPGKSCNEIITTCPAGLR